MDERRFQPVQTIATATVEVYRVVDSIAVPIAGSSMHCDLKNEVIVVFKSGVWVPDTRPGTQADLPSVLATISPEFVRVNSPRIFQRII